MPYTKIRASSIPFRCVPLFISGITFRISVGSVSNSPQETLRDPCAMTFSPGNPGLASGWTVSAPPSSDTSLPVNEVVVQLEGKAGDITADVMNAKIEAQLKHDGEMFRKEESNVLKVLLLGQAGSGVFIFPSRM